MRPIIWLLKKCDVQAVPSFREFRHIQKHSQDEHGPKPLVFHKEGKKDLCVNGPKGTVSSDWSSDWTNPRTRRQTILNVFLYFFYILRFSCVVSFFLYISSFACGEYSVGISQFINVAGSSAPLFPDDAVFVDSRTGNSAKLVSLLIYFFMSNIKRPWPIGRYSRS